MSYITLEMSKEQLLQLKKHYQNDLIKPVPHSMFRAKTSNNVTVTAYNSGKVLFQGTQALREADQWQFLAQPPLKSKRASSFQTDMPVNFSNWTIIGSDEVGNGSYFGPLTVCAVYLDPPLIELAQKLGAKDSKQLTDEAIQRIAQQLKNVIPYALTICSPAEYNRLNQSKNANAIKVHLHNLTIQKLYQTLTSQQKNQLQTVFVDEFTSPKRYNDYLKNETNPYEGRVMFSKQGESKHLAVASASIIAREAFLTSLKELGQPYGITLPSGAGANVDKIGRQLVHQFGSSILSHLAKMHFANTNKIL